METIPITIRIPDNRLQIIDSYAKEKSLSRSELFRTVVDDMVRNIEETRRKNKLIAASRKTSAYNIKENLELEATLGDGLQDER